MTDNWQRMWVIQSEQQKAFGLDPEVMTGVEKGRVVKDLLLGLYEETQELSRCVAQHKQHVLKTPSIEKVNVIEEITDVLKYLMSIAQIFDINAEEVFEGFLSKTQVISDKAEGARCELERDTKLLGVDLDGCVADISSWQRFMEKQGKMADWEAIDELEALKAEYYRCGGFRDVPMIDGAREALAEFRAAGYKIVIITARPHWQYKRLYADTIHWLKKNGIEHDLLLFNKDKAEALYEHIHPATPAWFIEDRDKHAMELVNIGINVLLLDYKYNENVEHDLITRVYNWDEIKRVVLGGGNDTSN